MNKVKRIKLKIMSIFMLVLLLSLELSPFAVKATAQKLQFYSSGIVAVGYDSYNAKNVWYGNATLGGVTAYCVDYTCGLPSGTMTFSRYLSDQGLSILVHGYPNRSAAQMGLNNNEEAYMATQMALWDVLNKTGESHKSGRIFKVENVTPISGKEGFYNRTVAAAKNLVALAQSDPYNEVPTLTVTTKNAALNYIGDDALFGPYNVNVSGVDASTIKSISASLEGAPSSARITDANGNTKFSISNGDDIYVRMSSTEDSTTFKLKFSTDVDRVVGCIYTSNGSTQDYVRLDKIPNSVSQEVTIGWQRTRKVGMIELQKVDQDGNNVSGAKFRLTRTDGTVIGDVTTGTDGRVVFANVPVGDYVLTELEAPYGYEITEQSKNVTVKENETSYVKVTNNRMKASVIIIKTDEDSNPIQGVKFEISNSNGVVLQTITTNARGLAGVRDLPLGTYYYKEIEAPDNYVIDSNKHEFKLDTKDQVLKIDVVNEKIKGSLKITKVDDLNNTIANVKFNILDSNGNVVDTITTNKDGIATSKELEKGTYYYQETEVPSGYIKDSSKHEFTISTNNQVVEKKVVNNTEKGKLKITKYDSNGNYLANVKFNILDSNGNVVDTIVTNKNGVAESKSLKLGTYYYQEIEAPSNVQMDTQKHTFIISSNNQVITKTVVNKNITGKLKIIKVDENKNPLAGVTFEILDSNKNVIDTIVTNEEGIAESQELQKGTYYYKETAAPEGIIIDSNEYKFEITSNGQNVIKNIINNYAKGTIQITKYDSNGKLLEGVKFQILNDAKEVVDTIVTNKDGIAESKKLKLGTYYYQEIEAPDNVVMDTKIHEFKLSTNNEVVKKQVVNDLIEGKLKIIKVDENNKPLAGVTFDILDANKVVVDTIVTNSEGIAESKELVKGTYYYKETAAPDGIKIDNTEYKFEIVEDGQNVIKNMVNYYEKGTLKIIKVDENNKPLQGVTFEILDANKNVVDTIVTNEEGIAQSQELQKGTYYYKETAAPEGIRIDNTEYEFEIVEDGQNVIRNMINYYEKGTLKIIKVDENDKPLQGVTFEILDSNKNVIDTIVTNEEGIAESQELQKGTYYYKETAAPEGIIVDNTEYEFEIVEDGQNVIKNMVNYYAKGSLKIVKVDSNNTPLQGVSFDILDTNGNVVDSVVTDKDGIAASKKLPLGTYYYKETKAPDNVVMDSATHEFKLETNDQIVEVKVVNELVEGKLKIVKVDSNNTPLQGVKFEVTDANGSVVDTIITDSDGVASTKSLRLGTYSYREIEAPDNVVMDSASHEFKLETNNQVVEVKVVNKLIEGKLKIIKVDENNVPLQGVKFEILDSNKNVVDTIVTNEEGVAQSKDLEKGTYYYKEIEAPDGIIVDSTEYEFEIVEDGQNVIKNMINYYAKGSLKITKEDSNNRLLSGVTFEITDANGNVVDTIVTGKDGIATSKKLPLGTYYYKEIKAPDNVIMDSDPHEFILTENNQVIEKTVINKLVEGKLKIIKVDENDIPLSGVAFEILDKNKNVVDIIVTDKDGVATSHDLEKGEYYYKEVDAPDGIVIDNNLYPFEIVEDGQNVIKNMVNYYKKGQLQITKLVDKTNEKLAGVTFDILDSDRNVIETVTTDENGVAYSSKLRCGTYYFKEVDAPQGYIKDSNEYEFSIVENEEIVQAVVYNAKEELPITGGKLGTNEKIILIVSAIGIFGYIVVRALSDDEEYYM